MTEEELEEFVRKKYESRSYAQVGSSASHHTPAGWFTCCKHWLAAAAWRVLQLAVACVCTVELRHVHSILNPGLGTYNHPPTAGGRGGGHRAGGAAGAAADQIGRAAVGGAVPAGLRARGGGVPAAEGRRVCGPQRAPRHGRPGHQVRLRARPHQGAASGSITAGCSIAVSSHWLCDAVPRHLP